MIIEHALIIALCVHAINACFWEGMIFEEAGNWLETNAHWFWKPSVGCPICMVPWSGSILHLLFFNDWDLGVLLVAMGINAVIVATWNRL